MSYKTASLTYCLAKSLRTIVRPLYRWHVFRTFDADNVETNDSLGYIEKGQEIIYQFGHNCLLTDKGYYVLMPDSRDVAFDSLKVTVYDADSNDVGIVYLNIADLTGLEATRDFAEKNLCVLTSPSNTYLDNQIIREVDVNAGTGVSVYFYSALFRVTGKDSRSSNPINITLQEAPDWLYYIHFQKNIGNYLSLQGWCDRMIQTVSGARIEIRLPKDLPVYIYEISVMTMEGEYIATWELDENQSGVFYFDAYKDCIIILNKYCPYCLYSAYTTHSNGNGIDWVYNTNDNGVTATYSRVYCGIYDKIDDEELHSEVYDSISKYIEYFSSQYPGISFPYGEFSPMLVDKNIEYSISFNSLLRDDYDSRPLLNNIILVDWFTNEVIKVLTTEDAVQFLDGTYYWNEVVTRPTIIQSSVTSTLGQIFEVPITIHYSLGINILDILRVSGDILDLGNNTLVAKVISGGVIEIKYNSEFPSYISASCGVPVSILPAGTNTLVSSRIYHTKQGGMYDSYTITITTDSPTCIYSESRSVEIPSSTVFKGGDNPKVFKIVPFSKLDKSYVYTSTNNKDINRNYTSIPMVFANNATVRDISIYSDISEAEIFSVESGCFLNCVALKSINFNLSQDPNVLFAFRSFYNCQSLSDFVAPLNTLSLDDLCFSGDSSLKRVILPQQLNHIGKYCFSFNTSLTSITSTEAGSNIDGLLFRVDSENFNNIDAIKEGTFSSCTNLTDINLPSSIVNIESKAFENCNSIKHFTSPGLFLVKNKAFANTWIDGTTSSDTELVLEGTTYGEHSLYKKIGTTGILFDIPGTSFGGLNKNYTMCTYISPTIDNTNLILYKCNAKQIGGTGNGRYLYALHPKTISISPYAFSGNYDFGNIGYYADVRLSESDVPIESSLRYIGEGAFYNNSRLMAFRFPLNGIVNYLGEGAFLGCTRLSDLYNFRLQPITKIKDYTFYNCGDNIYGLGALTDARYPNLDFYIPDTTEEIGNYAFAKCPQLMTIANLPSCNITKIGDHAFEGSLQNSTWKTKLGSEIALFTTMMVLSLAGGICYSGFILAGQLVITAVDNLIAGCIGAAGGAVGSITSIATSGKNYRKLTAELFFPKATSIGKAAFKNCSHLGAIHLSEKLLVIPDYCFENCKRLHTFLFDSLYNSKTGESTDRMPNITTIGRRAFYNCKNLKVASMNRLLCKAEVLDFLAFANAELTSSGDENLVIFPKTIHTLLEQSLLISNGFTCVFLSKTPPENVHTNVFGTTIKSKITMFVPEGSKSIYLQKFTALPSSNFIELSDTAPFWESLNGVYTL